MKKTKQQSGFITLFFILGISFTLLFLINIGSERVFEYIHTKQDFVKNREYLHNIILCADIFVNNNIKSDFNNTYTGDIDSFIRNAYMHDDYICNIKDIDIEVLNGKISQIIFKIDDYGFVYKFNNGVVNSIKSFKLF